MMTIDELLAESIRSLSNRVAQLEAMEQVAYSGGLPKYPVLTQGSVLFAGASGVLAQDNVNFYWDDTNNWLGIGTRPSYPLDLSTSGFTALRVNTTSTAHKRGYVIFSQGGIAQMEMGVDVNANNNRNFYIYDDVAGALRLLIDDAGNLVLGGIAATAKFDVNGSIRCRGNFYVGDSQTSRCFYDDGTNTHFSANFVVDGNIYWGTGGNWLSAYLNQVVTTGSAPTFAGLTLNTAHGTPLRIFEQTSTYATSIYQSLPNIAWDGGMIAFNWRWTGSAWARENTGYAATFWQNVGGQNVFSVIDSSGNQGYPLQFGRDNVGIGVAQGSANRLFTKGITSDSNYNAFIAQNSNASNLMYLRNDGLAWVNQAWTIGSDERLKEHIRDEDRGLAILRLLKPRRYDRKIGAKDEHGFVAQEIQGVVPELVSSSSSLEEGDEPVLGIQYGGLFGILTRAIQELDAQQVTQNARLTALEACIDIKAMQELTDRLIKLEQQHGNQ